MRLSQLEIPFESSSQPTTTISSALSQEVETLLHSIEKQFPNVCITSMYVRTHPDGSRTLEACASPRDGFGGMLEVSLTQLSPHTSCGCTRTAGMHVPMQHPPVQRGVSSWKVPTMIASSRR